MNESNRLKLIEIMFTFSVNTIAISRYIEKVPPLINGHISEKEIQSEKNKIEKKHDDLKIAKRLKNLWNGFVTVESSFDRVHLPSYFNSSATLLVFALLEDTSREIGKSAKQLAKTRLGLGDINESNDVRKMKIYLEKHIGLDLSAKNELWSKIDTYISVRNCIIHQNSKPSDRDTKPNRKFKKHLENDDRIKFEEGIFSIIDSKYVEEFLEISQEYIEFLLDSLTDKFPE